MYYRFRKMNLRADKQYVVSHLYADSDYRKNLFVTLYSNENGVSVFEKQGIFLDQRSIDGISVSFVLTVDFHTKMEIYISVKSFNHKLEDLGYFHFMGVSSCMFWA